MGLIWAGGIFVTDAASGRHFLHMPLLGSVAADAPAAQKIFQLLAHAAVLGCGFCTLRGVPNPVSERGSYFLGYASRTAASEGHAVILTSSCHSCSVVQ